MELDALLLELGDSLGGEVPPFPQALGLGRRGGPGLLQLLFFVQAGVELGKELVKVPVGEGSRFLLLPGIVPQEHGELGQSGKALGQRRVGALLFRQMDDAQRAEPVQQCLFLGSNGHHMDDIHFFDHRFAS